MVLRPRVVHHRVEGIGQRAVVIADRELLRCPTATDDVVVHGEPFGVELVRTEPLESGHGTVAPPATLRICPVTKDASSDARKAIAAACSRGSPRLPIGIDATTLATIWAFQC